MNFFSLHKGLAAGFYFLYFQVVSDFIFIVSFLMLSLCSVCSLSLSWFLVFFVQLSVLIGNFSYNTSIDAHTNCDMLSSFLFHS